MWLLTLLGLHPCRSELPERNIRPCTRTLEIHSDRTNSVPFPVPSPSQWLHGGRSTDQRGPGLLPHTKGCRGTSEPHGLNGVGVGQICGQNWPCWRTNAGRARMRLSTVSAEGPSARLLCRLHRRGRSQGEVRAIDRQSCVRGLASRIRSSDFWK